MTRTQPLRRRRGVVLALAAALALPTAVYVAPMAFAADGPFVIDGDLVPDSEGAQELGDETGNVKELGPLNSSTTKIGVIHTDALPTLGKTNPNGQVDLRRAWLDTEREGTKDWLYFGWERDNNTGSGFIAFEFMQDPPPEECTPYESTLEADLISDCNPWKHRKAGDFMILWDQQGGSLDLFLRTWIVDDNGNLALTPPGGALNAVVSQAAYGYGGFRGEAALNLTDTIFGGSTACRSFANVIPSTVTGNSDTADYKDTILGTADPITNCGTVKIKKETVNRDGSPLSTGAGSFVTRLNRADDSDITYAKAATATTPAVPAVRFYDDTHVVTAGSSGFTTHADLKAGTNYQLAETAVATGYELYGIRCKVGSGAFADANNLTFEVQVGVTTECVVQNQPALGTLVIKKVVANNNGGLLTTSDFSYALNGATAVTFPVDGSGADEDATAGTAAVSVSLAHGTAFAVTEPEANTRGYATTLGGCTGTITAGQTSTCTITNDDRPAQLTVVKTVVNDNGGTLVVGSFPLFVGATAVTSGTKNTFTPGSYTVSETQQPGYTADAWGGDCGANGAVTLALGDDKTCTITNRDIKATPTGTTIQRWVLHDTLTVANRRATAPDAASATATFKVFSNAACTAQVGTTETVAIGAATSAQSVTGVAVTNPGTYYWEVTFSGDQYNNGFTTPCGSEEGAETTTITAVDDRPTS